MELTWPVNCGSHSHASQRAKDLCQGPGVVDEIPDLGVRGIIYCARGPVEEGGTPLASDGL